MACRGGVSAEQSAVRGPLERFVELLGAYSSTILTSRLLDLTTGGELTPAQLDALSFIHRHGGCSAKALSEGLHISIPSATRLVDRLVRKRLVDRQENDDDRRLVSLTLTPAGNGALCAVRDARVAHLQQALEVLAPAERMQLLTLLDRFLRAVLSDVKTIEGCCLHCGAEHDRSCVVNEIHESLVGRSVEHP